MMEAQKDKSTALLLAIFFGFWTYLYTYKIDKIKFWLAIGLFIPTLSISMFVFWVMAIIQTVNRDQSFYVNYDLSAGGGGKSLLDTFLTDDDVENIKIREIFSRIQKCIRSKDTEKYMIKLLVCIDFLLKLEIWIPILIFFISITFFTRWDLIDEAGFFIPFFIIRGIYLKLIKGKIISYITLKWGGSTQQIEKILLELKEINIEVYNKFGDNEELIKYL